MRQQIVKFMAGLKPSECPADRLNEPGSEKSLISMDRLEFYTSDVGGQTTTDISSLGILRWSLDGAGDSYVLLDAARNHGSGSGDMYAYIPVANFADALPTDFVYMYVRFGDQVGASSAGGFEEWSIGLTDEPVNISTRLSVLVGDNVAIAGSSSLALFQRRCSSVASVPRSLRPM